MPKRINQMVTIILAGLFLLGSAGCAGQTASKVMTVSTVQAKNSTLTATMEMSGVLVPAKTADISSKISGQVTALGYQVGSRVKIGDILIKLDTESIKVQLQQAQASLQAARAGTGSADNQTAIAKTNLDAAQRNYDRMSSLFASGAVSQSQVDEAADKLNLARKQYQSAAGPAEQQAQAAISTAQATIKNYQLQLANGVIKSPINGIITNQSVNVGQVISPGVTVISVIDTAVLKLKTTIAQDKLPLLTQGMEVDIAIDSYPDQLIKGTITSIGPIAVSTGEVFPVEITMQNSQGLLAGLSAHAALVTTGKGIIVPASAVIQEGGESYLFVIKDDIASRRQVKVGLQNDQELIILQGLNDGEQVAVSNISGLMDQMPVNVKN